MKSRKIRIITGLLGFLVILCLCVFFLSRKEKPTSITYGISYNVPYLHELGLDEDVVLDAFLHDLNVRHFRMSAHWTLTEPKKDVYDFAWMDRDLEKVEKCFGGCAFIAMHLRPH